MRKTMIEIIDETVEFYSKNPRSTDDGFCVYNGPGGTHCAIARIVLNPAALIEIDTDYKGNPTGTQVKDIKPEQYKPGYGYHPVEFYDNLQNLHDCDHYWGEAGLSQAGEGEVLRMKNKWK